MANQLANYAKGMLLKGQIASADTFKMILMQSGFVFNKDTHKDYSDVIASELANGLGYTTGGCVLTGGAVAVSTALDNATLSWDYAQWVASGGSLVASGAIIYDDSTDITGGDDYTDAIISYTDFNGDVTVADGQIIRVTNTSIIVA